MSADDFGSLLKRVGTGAQLSTAEAAGAFSAIMRGEVSDTRIAAFLTALVLRKPGVDEIVGAVQAMRAAMQTVRAPEGAIDVCGTGGDGLGTLNVSTAVGFVVAACGVPVAKHGNRSISSLSGAADVLEQLAFAIDVEPARVEQSLAQTGFAFLFAPKYHAAMRHVAAVRRELGFRTIFNLIGPLSNPAQVRHQLIGVFARDRIEPVAHALRELGTATAWVMHSEDGMDELSIAAPTHVAVLQDGKIFPRTISPEDAGLQPSPLAAIKGGDAQFNANAMMQMLSGEDRGAYRDVVLLNAAAALLIAGKARDLKDGAEQAATAIDSGRALEVLRKSAALSKSAP